MRRSVVQAALTLLACVALLGGLIAAGRLVRQRLRDSARHQFPFRDIECPAPPEMDRSAFLSEVQYLSEFPDQIPLLDDELPQRLALAFARHAWVERVEKIEIGPGRAVRARLTFRTPVLVVSYAPVKGGPLTPRVLDGQGILLPRLRDDSGLPHLVPALAPPAGSAGQPWSDKLAERAVAIAAMLHSHRPLKLSRIDLDEGEFRLTMDAGAIVKWGHAPGEEAEGEALAEGKIRRLLEYCDLHGNLNRPDPKAVHDVRTTR